MTELATICHVVLLKQLVRVRPSSPSGTPTLGHLHLISNFKAALWDDKHKQLALPHGRGCLWHNTSHSPSLAWECPDAGPLVSNRLNVAVWHKPCITRVLWVPLAVHVIVSPHFHHLLLSSIIMKNKLLSLYLQRAPAQEWLKNLPSHNLQCHVLLKLAMTWCQSSLAHWNDSHTKQISCPTPPVEVVSIHRDCERATRTRAHSV